MDMIGQYERAKNSLLDDMTICKENRELFRDFFEFQERKLKRINGMPQLDDSSYKTLCSYPFKFRNLNSWLKNKAWKRLTREDITKVYDDLEDGKILNHRGKPIVDRQSYYNKIMKSKPFQMAGKSDLAREVIEYTKSNQAQVRFFEFEDFQKMVKAAKTTTHKALLWLAFDIGENIESILQLKKKDFTRQYNKDIKEYEYLINLHKDILKRSRTARGEPTLHQETVRLLDAMLQDFDDDDLVFSFQYSNARYILQDITKEAKVKCKPNNDEITWKDFRSSMACYLLNKNWSTDDINQRLGHTPSSRTLDKYVNFLAKKRRQPKKIFYSSQIEDVKTENEQLSAEVKRQREAINIMLKAMLQKGMVTNKKVSKSKISEHGLDKYNSITMDDEERRKLESLMNGGELD